ncbi:hypothetical protein [Mucilaginibacter sp. FT3.2]|uniref:hypothetical protein n=1 Tax=Mucilaginibacter sp. FT3.2 TaxID=2723090 RepID=UPI00160E6E6D|nr:hypothetical protein [Mucilaginibacter sp. FT3.2]MBB6232933.1 hypothetical protein [Mucilaginibacter sp. FT3.2]
MTFRKILQAAFIMLLFCLGCHAQIKNNQKILLIPFEPAKWDTTAAKAEFVAYKGAKAIKMHPHGGQINVKGLMFTNGTIEFDTQPIDAETRGFGPIGIYFRQQNAKESEYVYLRTKGDDSKRDNDDIQYAPVVNGVLLFNMMSPYDGPAPVHNKEWNHVKLVVSGMQMRVYVNNMNEPVLEIPRLESSSKAGTIGFDGLAYFANLMVKPNDVGNLSALEGIDPTKHDMNYIRNWDVTASRIMGQGKELTTDDLPKDSTQWHQITAERRGVINLSRKFGASDTGRYVWLKTTINSTKEQVMQMQLGFCDEVYVFANSKLIDADKNQFGLPLAKFPNGCLNIDNSMVNIPLKVGANTLLIGVVNNFYSWGIIARLRNLSGISLKN